MTTNIQVYLSGTITRAARAGIVNGEMVATLQVHPDNTPEDSRRWVRTRGDLANWMTTTDELAEGASIIAVGVPYRAEGAATRSAATPAPVWMLDATRITIDRTTPTS